MVTTRPPSPGHTLCHPAVLCPCTGTSLPMRKAAYRRILAGPRIFRHGRWFAANTTSAELAAIDHLEARRLARNLRQRRRMRAKREADAFESHISRLPPWVQTRLYGRTATVTEHDGWWVPVDYRKTYGRHPFNLPGIPGERQAEYLLDLIKPPVVSCLLRIGDAMFGKDFPKRWLGWRRVDEKRHAREIERARSLDPTVRTEQESRHRLTAERRKVNRRATIATCPSADDIRVAWAFVREDPNGPLVLGGLLLDLECFVDNSLVIEEHPDGNKIKARHGGIRAWLRRNCPELSGKYKTLMRHKSLARKLRQAVEIPDPVPTSELLGGNLTADEITMADIHEQPRPFGQGEEPSSRFAWEQSSWRYDANGRPYRGNTRYLYAWTFPGASHMLAPLLASARKKARAILTTNGRRPYTKDIGKSIRRWRISELATAVEAAVKCQERWWEAPR